MSHHLMCINYWIAEKVLSENTLNRTGVDHWSSSWYTPRVGQAAPDDWWEKRSGDERLRCSVPLLRCDARFQVIQATTGATIHIHSFD